MRVCRARCSLRITGVPSRAAALAWLLIGLTGCTDPQTAPAEQTRASPLPSHTPSPAAPATSDAPADSTGSVVPRCGAAEDAPQLGLPAHVDVGDFIVAVDAGGGLLVTHARGPGRGVLQTPSHTPPLSASSTSLDVEEHQGSFDIHRATTAQCVLPELHVVRADGHGLTLVGGFHDTADVCSGVVWQMSLCEARAGHLAFSIETSSTALNHLTLLLESSAEERIFGLGEQFARERLSLKGRRIDVLAQEGGVGRGHQPISGAIDLASPGSAGSEDSAYAPMPHILTSSLRSILLENDELSTFDFTRDDETRIEVHAPTLRGRAFAGRTPKELLERTTELVGRMPALPTWVDEGAVVALARDIPRARELVASLEAHGARIAAVWNQTWSGKVTTHIGEQVLWNWVQNPESHPEWRDFVDELEARGVRTLCYVNPMLVDPPDDGPSVTRALFDEAQQRGYFVKDAQGADLSMPVTAFNVGLVDVTNPEARAWFKDLLRAELVERARCSGWMADFGEALPFEAVMHSGEDGAAFHNRYPVEWMRLNREAVEEMGGLGELLVFNRSGFTKTPSVSLLMWEGDQLTTWDKYDGVVSALHGLLDGGFSGITLNHSDTGGYTSLSAAGLVGYERESELLMRWTEMNAFTVLLRTHEGNQPDVNAQVYGSTDAMAHFARFTRVFRALTPIRREAMREATEHGWPVARHLWIEFPDDARALDVDDQFMLGSDVLVAPIKNKCWTWPVCPYDKEVYVPAGQWVHLWTGRVFDSDGADFTVAAPLGEPAVFVRADSPRASSLRARLREEGIPVPEPQL